MEALGPVRTCSDAFGCVQMHLDAYGCGYTHLDTFGNFQQNWSKTSFPEEFPATMPLPPLSGHAKIYTRWGGPPHLPISIKWYRKTQNAATTAAAAHG